jgi:hypothetical protein
MEFEAYLKNAEDASLEGITGMKISGDGRSKIISMTSGSPTGWQAEGISCGTGWGPSSS